jgi:hypothetical protein
VDTTFKNAGGEAFLIIPTLKIKQKFEVSDNFYQ